MPFFRKVKSRFSHDAAHMSLSLGGAKMGDNWEKTPDHLQAELELSHMFPFVFA